MRSRLEYLLDVFCFLTSKKISKVIKLTNKALSNVDSYMYRGYYRYVVKRKSREKENRN